MGEIFAYSLGSSLVLTFLYLVYKWMLATQNHPTLNRRLLWMIYLVSLTALPIYSFVADLFSTQAIHPGISIDLEGISSTLELVSEKPASILPSIILWLYIAGMIVATLSTSINLFQILHILSKGTKTEINGIQILLTERIDVAPFSFGNYIVISEKEAAENINLIVLHEKGHLILHHWVDLLFSQIVAIFQWYNPTAWLMREEFKTVHEFQADRLVLNSGVNMKDYQYLLIKKAVGARFPSLTNNLSSKLKKRILMMCNQNSSRSSRILRPLLLVPALGAALWLTNVPAVASVIDSFVGTSLTPPSSSNGKVTNFISKPGHESAEKSIGGMKNESYAPIDSSKPTVKEKKQEIDKSSKPADAVEKCAEFPGGMQALFSFLADHIKSPNDNTPSGRVIVRFVVEADGSIGNAEIVKGLSPSMDAEALRVVKMMPRWIPAEVDGRPVASNYVLPVKYVAEENTSIFVLPGGASNETADGSSSSSSSSSSSNVMTSVSTSTNSAGQTQTTTIISAQDEKGQMAVSYTSSKKNGKDYTVYVDGKKYEGDITAIPSSQVASMRIDQTDDNPATIYITLKK